MKRTRVLFLWARYSGYMAACWNRLASIPGVEVDVVAIGSRPNDASDPVFDKSVMQGISTRLITQAESNDANAVRRKLPSEKPDVVVVSGWGFAGYLNLIRQEAFGPAPLVVCSDNPIRHDWRQRFGIYKIRWLLNRASRVLVTGESGFQLMRYWRVPSKKIVKGLYGVDEAALVPCLGMRNDLKWPRNFIFAGRYCERKGVDLMLRAYDQYRKRHEDPWRLVCCGRGDLDREVSSHEGVKNLGFIQPNELPNQLARASAFVLASRSDAWPLSLVEAALSGLPIICTSACGSSAELTRDLFNGRIVAANDVNALTEAMGWIHHQAEGLPTFGQRSQELARAFTSSEWALRIQHLLNEVQAESQHPLQATS